MAESCGPYLVERSVHGEPTLQYQAQQGRMANLAALSYSSNTGMANSFMFFGTAKTSRAMVGAAIFEPELADWYGKGEAAHSFLASGPRTVSCTP